MILILFPMSANVHLSSCNQQATSEQIDFGEHNQLNEALTLLSPCQQMQLTTSEVRYNNFYFNSHFLHEHVKLHIQFSHLRNIETDVLAMESRLRQPVHKASQYPKPQVQQVHHGAFQVNQQIDTLSVIFPGQRKF